MDVKLVARTLDLFELFAAEQRPLPLIEMARLLDAPSSSCLALARTLVSRGYLYEVRKRGGYYPTRRLQLLANAINAVDPVVEMLHPRLVELRDATGETIVLGKIHGTAVVYLDVVESEKAVRYSCAPGTLRPLHANSIGKVVFGELDPSTQEALSAKLQFERYTDATAPDLATFIDQISTAHERGWYANIGESAPELSAVAVALDFGGDLYGLSIGGPTERVRQRLNEHVATLVKAKEQILLTWKKMRQPEQ
ncbi:IclR family transcriptional regulator [Paraburkholderia acidicola]|uniref:IclR family transcriptional regulator n=1 Tax=Paraburkholderia acidicola TaxID=1912599 RepID=A0ABV1LWU1_9BURK